MCKTNTAPLVDPVEYLHFPMVCLIFYFSICHDKCEHFNFTQHGHDFFHDSKNQPDSEWVPCQDNQILYLKLCFWDIWVTVKHPNLDFSHLMISGLWDSLGSALGLQPA